MKKVNFTIATSGTGYWSDVARNGILINGLEVDSDLKELRIFFDTESWLPSVDGLIYTDPLAMSHIKTQLTAMGLSCNNIGYSEQGMQGDNYISLDIDVEFIDSLDIDVEFIDSSHKLVTPTA